MLLKRFKDFKKLNEEVDFSLEDDVVKKEKPKEEAPVADAAAPKEEPVSTENDKSDEDSNTADKYEKVKEDLKKMLEETGNEKDILKRAKDESIEALNIKNFNQDSDVYDFYLAHQFEIDEKLNEENFFENKMSELGISSLYNATIVGTQFAVKKFIQEF